MSAQLEVLTVGHSTHPWERFVALLRGADVNAVADVRSSPHSKHFPRFNREELREELRLDGISYVFLGRELGGRPTESRLYCQGVADYDKMAEETGFRKGLERVIEGAKKYRVALMCSERDPLECHRCLLVGRALAQRGVLVSHILEDGRILHNDKIEETLLKLSHCSVEDLFAPRAERLTAAYRERARKVAFKEQRPDQRAPMTAK